MTFHLNIATCARCPNQQKNCAGPCACRVDGVDIIDHATLNNCPQGRYGKDSTAIAGLALPVPENHDPATVKAGGCCDPPKEG